MKHINCKVIEKPSTEWSFWRIVIDRDKYKNFDINSLPDTVDFCNSIEPNTNTNIKIIKRIGSVSADGEVYHVQFNGMDFAMKLMPRIDSDGEIKNKNEIETSLIASKYSEYFPLTFAYGFCDNSSYYVSTNGNTSSYITKAIEYHNYSLLIQQITSKNIKKRFDNDYRAKIPLNILANKYNLTMLEENKIEVDFMLSELANGDLGNWMMIKRDMKDWNKILLDIVVGTYYLTVMVGKVIPDLHPGNILILRDPLKALIHDFGRSYPVDDEISPTYKATLLSFCSEFLSCSTRNDLIIPRDILVKIQDIYNILMNTNIDKNNIKCIYDNLIIPIISY